jgi:GTP cyclohydrolase IA
VVGEYMAEKNDVDKQTTRLANIYLDLISTVKENPKREGLRRTPYRAAKALQFLTQGYNLNSDDIVRGALFTSDNSEMVVLKDIELFSLCEHHLLPIIGKCHVGYLPRGKIIGLSKIPRIVDMFARRLQVQENLTMQIAECVLKVTGGFGVGIVIEAEHLCMIARGVEKRNVVVKTSSMLGSFRSSAKTRNEFLSLLK